MDEVASRKRREPTVTEAVISYCRLQESYARLSAAPEAVGLARAYQDVADRLTQRQERHAASPTLREDVTPSGVAALRMAADNMPLRHAGQPWVGAAEWLHRRADAIEKHVIT